MHVVKPDPLRGTDLNSEKIKSVGEVWSGDPWEYGNVERRRDAGMDLQHAGCACEMNLKFVGS